MMRRIFLVSTALLFMAAACGGEDSSQSSSAGGAADAGPGASGTAGASASAGAAGKAGSGGGAAGLGGSSGGGSAGAGGEITPENVDDLVGEPTSEQDMERLAEWMTGAFDSKDMEGQTQVDSAGVYTYIWADLKQVRIWPDEPDGYWFYVEQAEHGELPYRTRIYHLTIADAETYEVDSYKLPYGSTTYSAAFDDPTIFDGVALQDTGAVHNPDCNVVFKRKDGRYYGHNDMERCTVNMGTVLSLDSFSIVEENQFYSHDRGYRATGELAMGPGVTGYTFIKRDDYPIQ